jgi:hypothetical protein
MGNTDYAAGTVKQEITFAGKHEGKTSLGKHTGINDRVLWCHGASRI